MSRFRDQLMGPVSGQPDQAQYDAYERARQGNMVPFDEVIKFLNAQNLPPQLRQTPYVRLLSVANAPVLLIPANPNRMGFLVTLVDIGQSANNFIYMSYGYPLSVKYGGGGLVTPVGIPIVVTTTYQEGNGTVSIDDIYVSAPQVGVGPMVILGYEGLLSIESRLHIQTNLGSGPSSTFGP